MHGTVKPKPQRKATSAVSNGTRLFQDPIDMRSARGRRYKSLLDAYAADVGATLDESQRSLIRDLSIHQLVCEDLQQSYMESGELDYGRYGRASNAMRRCMSALALIKREPKSDDEDDGMTPLDYVNRPRHRERLED